MSSKKIPHSVGAILWPGLSAWTEMVAAVDGMIVQAARTRSIWPFKVEVGFTSKMGIKPCGDGSLLPPESRRSRGANVHLVEFAPLYVRVHHQKVAALGIPAAQVRTAVRFAVRPGGRDVAARDAVI